MSKTTTVNELRRSLQEKRDVVIVDVRRQADYAASQEVIPGSIWRDPEKAEEWTKDLPEQKEVIIYCVRGGSVSQSVSKRLADAKVNVSYIEGGIAAWKEAGGEVEPK
jgi:rhodanese-related sulfurtransferase